MVEEVAGLALLVDESALVEIAIDRLEDCHATSSLVHGELLCRRELGRLRELACDLGRPCLDQPWRMNACLTTCRFSG